jgi:hypothetical protein
MGRAGNDSAPSRSLGHAPLSDSIAPSRSIAGSTDRAIAPQIAGQPTCCLSVAMRLGRRNVWSYALLFDRRGSTRGYFPHEAMSISLTRAVPTRSLTHRLWRAPWRCWLLRRQRNIRLPSRVVPISDHRLHETALGPQLVRQSW